MRKQLRSLVVLTGIAAAAPAIAEDPASGPYGQIAGGGNFAREQDLGPTAPSQEYEDGGLGSVSFGYAFANGLRPEVEYAIRDNDAENSSGNVESNGAMGNLWYDFGAPSFMPRLRPYLGGGAGRTELSLEDFGAAASGTNYEKNVTAYQGGAGVNYGATRNLVVSLGYRFFETEKARFADAAAGTGGLLAATPGSAAVEDRYRSDGVLAGVRYVFGGRSERIASSGATAEAAAFETVVLRPVNFQLNSADLTEPSKETLDDIAKRLASHADVKIVIEGYTDNSGEERLNKQLGKQRAEAVRDYLAGKGLQKSNMQVASRGEASPVADNESEEGRAKNRRAEVKPQGKPANVKIVIEPATEESVEAAQEK